MSNHRTDADVVECIFHLTTINHGVAPMNIQLVHTRHFSALKWITHRTAKAIFS